MRGDEAAGIAGLCAPSLQPGSTVMKIGQSFLPVGVCEGSCVPSNWAGSGNVAIGFAPHAKHRLDAYIGSPNARTLARARGRICEALDVASMFERKLKD
jgi:hypothetical protein